MVRRRLYFAAPIVLVIASCKHPVAEPMEPEEQEEEAPVVVAVPPDAAIEEPADAAADAPPDAMTGDELLAACQRGTIKCSINPPSPRRPLPPDRMVTGNPPRPMRARVLKTEYQGARIVLTFAVGTEAGVDAKTWRAWLVRDDLSRVPGGEITLVRCDKRTCVGVSTLTYDQVQANPNAAVAPK